MLQTTRRQCCVLSGGHFRLRHAGKPFFGHSADGGLHPGPEELACWSQTCHCTVPFMWEMDGR